MGKSFNPSQVGYKLTGGTGFRCFQNRFNPSQVGYKHFIRAVSACEAAFQSLTGRLQTHSMLPQC